MNEIAIQSPPAQIATSRPPKVKVQSDISGLASNKLTVITRSSDRYQSGRWFAYWSCICSCGSKKDVQDSDIRSSKVKSCGGCRRLKYGINIERGPESAIYTSFHAMHQRCYNPNAAGFNRYGGRGISVCKRWFAFSEFLLDMKAGWAPGLSLDRINNDGNYEPSNCRWATREQQARNQSRNRRITIDNVTRCVNEWAKVSGVNTRTITARLNKGWHPKRAVFMAPIDSKHRPVGYNAQWWHPPKL